MANIQIFTYNGSAITFDKGDSVMVNATEMAKPFGKVAKEWLSNKSTTEFINSLSAVRGIPPSELVKVIKGGTPSLQGTWMHEDVAMEFARWLSPALAIWTNDRIKELLTKGTVSILSDDEKILEAMQLLNGRGAKLTESNRLLAQQNNILEGEKEHLTAENKAMAPKADYFDEVLQSDTTYTFTQVAKELGFSSALKLYADIFKKKVMYKQSDQWMAYAKYADKGYFTTRTARFYYKDGRPGSSISTVITEAGRQWLHSTVYAVR